MSTIEIPISKIFKFKRLPHSLTAIDVGARRGILSGFPELKPWKRDIDVIAIEPDKEDLEELRQDETGWKSVRLVNEPLTEKKGAVTLYVVPDHKGLSSLYKVSKEAYHRFAVYREKLKFIEDIVERELQATTLDAVCTKADIIKLDTQGSELDILKGGTNLLKTISLISIELEYQHLYFDQPLFKDVVQWLHDFELVHIEPKFQESDKGIEPVAAQCYFVKKCIASPKAESLRLIYPWFDYNTVPKRREYALWRFRFT